MALKLVTAPAIEPVTLLEVKEHLRIDSGTMADNLTVGHSILAGDQATIAAYGLLGASVDILASDVLIVLEAGTFVAGGKVDVKLQHSETGGAPWTDVTGGAFAQVTDATDERTYELAYNGGKRYVRAVATVAFAICAFGVYVIERAPATYEDALITGLIKAAREYCEGYQNRAYITQTWELILDAFPDSVIQIPLPPLQWVPTSVLAAAIRLANALKTAINAHYVDVLDHTTAPDIVNVIVSPASSSLPTLITLVTEMLTSYDAHDADAELVAGWAYHIAQEAGEHSLASIAAPINLPECITRLNDIRTKYNAHDADGVCHGVGNAHQTADVAGDMSITYYDPAGAAYTVTPADYQVDINSYKGRVCPTYGKTWPAMTLCPINGVVVRFKAGYGLLTTDVPERIRLAIKILAGHMYENREATDVKAHLEVPFAVHSLLGLDRILPL